MRAIYKIKRNAVIFFFTNKEDQSATKVYKKRKRKKKVEYLGTCRSWITEGLLQRVKLPKKWKSILKMSGKIKTKNYQSLVSKIKTNTIKYCEAKANMSKRLKEKASTSIQSSPQPDHGTLMSVRIQNLQTLMMIQFQRRKKCCIYKQFTPDPNRKGVAFEITR